VEVKAHRKIVGVGVYIEKKGGFFVDMCVGLLLSRSPSFSLSLSLTHTHTTVTPPPLLFETVFYLEACHGGGAVLENAAAPLAHFPLKLGQGHLVMML
jgi:hypothetical protein